MSAGTLATRVLFDSLCAQLHAEPDRKGEVWIDCPSCGKGKKHFSFNERTGHCFACDYSGSIGQIAALLNIRAENRPVKAAQKPVVLPKLWQQAPEQWLSRYTGALDRVTRWTAYKPLSIDSIHRWKLGVGVLPSSRCEKRRLILPVFDGGRIVAFHGRAYQQVDDTDAKWLTAGGSSKQMLFNGDLLRPGATVVIAENFIDTMLVMQAAPEVVAVAGGGVSWREEWTAQIAASRPKQVLVWLDHDWAGNCGPDHCDVCQEAYQKWRATCLPSAKIPEPSGLKIANQLLEAGVRASVYQWPKNTPFKADVGMALMRDQTVA